MTEHLDQEVLKIDCKQAESVIINFIKKTVEAAGAEGVVVGMSGGIDSSVISVLCVRALGPERVLGLIMPDLEITPKEDVEDAKTLAEKLGIRTHFIPINPVVDSFLKAVHTEADRIVKGNVRARTRMIFNYFFANALGYLVVGTGDRSEILIGYFTKYGDGGVDFSPISHFYKTQVRQFATYLELPEEIINKPASPQLWIGQQATDEIPVDYDVLDLILHGLFDLKMTPKEVASKLEVPVVLVDEVRRRFEVSVHKRIYPPGIENGESLRL